MRFPIANRRFIVKQVTRLMSYYRWPFTLVVGLQMASAALGLAVPWLLGKLVDQVAAGAGAGQVHQTALIMLGIFVAQSVFAFFGMRATMRLGETVFAHLREEMLQDVVSLPLSAVENAGTGDLLGRSTVDIDRIQFVVRFGLPQLLVLTFTITFTYRAALLLSVPLALSMLMCLPLVWLVLRWYLYRATPTYAASSAAEARVSGSLHEVMDNATTVDALGLAHSRLIRLNAQAEEAVMLERHASAPLRMALLSTMTFSFLAPVLIVIVWGTVLPSWGWTTVGAITSIALYTLSLRRPLSELIFWLDMLQSSAASLGRIFGVKLAGQGADSRASAATGEKTRESMQIEPMRISDKNTGMPRAGLGKITVVQLRGVTFAYRVGKNVLHGVDLEVRPGERLAIVGPSGAGKSTIGRLVAGINAPDEGHVLLRLDAAGQDGEPGAQTGHTGSSGHTGGEAQGAVAQGTVAQETMVEVSSVPDTLLRREVALVTQEHHVFGGTVVDNLRLARPELSENEAREVLATVGALSWAQNLPQGLDTELGMGAHELTDAQAQQLALARLLLLDPQVLILDEATSLLDPRSARALERSLDRVLAGRTVIAIAHRLYTAQDADRVAVVDGGRVIELGTHEELVALGGQYASLWESWQRG